MGIRPSKKILFLGYDKSETKLIEFLETRGCSVSHSSLKTTDFSSTQKNFDFQSFDLIISFGYRHIIPKNLIKISPPIINLHISMLPFNRGTHPVFWSHYDCTPNGITIHLIDEGIDTGAMLYQQEIYIDPKCTTFFEARCILISKIEKLFIANAKEILSQSYSSKKYSHSGSYHNSWDLPQDFSGWDENIAIEIIRLKNKVLLRDVTETDCDDVFTWRNDTVTRNMSLVSDILLYEDHLKWFKEVLEDPNEVFLLFQDTLIKSKLGIVRFALDQTGRTGLISINLSPEFRGKNYAKICLNSAIIELGSRSSKCRILLAEIKKDNIPSLNIFKGVGFQFFKDGDEFETYALKL